MRKRFSQALGSFLRRRAAATDETAASQDQLQQTMTMWQRIFPLIAQDLLQFFRQNHYSEWTSAFAGLMAEYLQEVMNWEDFAQMYQNQPVRLVLATSNLAFHHPRALKPYTFHVARLLLCWRSSKHSRKWQRKMVSYLMYKTVRCAVAPEVVIMTRSLT